MQEENVRLKRLVAELSLDMDKAMLQDVASKKWGGGAGLTRLLKMHRRANSPGDQWLAGKERLLERRKLTLAVVQKPGADQLADFSRLRWYGWVGAGHHPSVSKGGTARIQLAVRHLPMGVAAF